ncbi:MAG: hypothetical protein AAF447_10850 [Myxococcota bacterium]
MGRWAVWVALMVACGEGGSPRSNDMAVSDGPRDAGAPDRGEVIDEWPDPCAGVSGVVEVVGDITEDTTWCASAVYRLESTVVVGSGDAAEPAVLTIRPGTRIEGGTGPSRGAHLVIITTTGRIEAVGTAAEPIVMTSGNAPGTARPGDWGGLMLLGRAPINAPSGMARIDGFARTADVFYGGTDPAHDCGTLRYVRVEYVGLADTNANELNVLTVAGCGTATDIDYVQAHGGLDDGIEFYGGTVNATHLVVSSADDDGLDTDQGYVGTIQFMIVQAANTNHGFEMDNYEGQPDLTPQSNPKVWNFTILGFGEDDTSGVELAEGTGAELRNGIIAGYSATEGIDADDRDQLAALDAGTVIVENVVFAGNGTDIVNNDATTWDPTAAAANNQFGVVGKLLTDPSNVTAPDFSPTGDVDLSGGQTPTGLPSDPDFDPGAAYIGAIEPQGRDWTAGWTSFPSLGPVASE